MMAFLPMNKSEVEKLGWDSVDFVFVSGDSYVDHPSFGSAIITRVLESYGYSVTCATDSEIAFDLLSNNTYHIHYQIRYGSPHSRRQCHRFVSEA